MIVGLGVPNVVGIDEEKGGVGKRKKEVIEECVCDEGRGEGIICLSAF